jgi:hypothetical protein
MEAYMRMLMNITIPTDRFNEAVRNGTVGQKIGSILEDIKPESVFFTEQDGSRGAILVVNLDDPAKVPALAEPWFLAFDAKVKFQIAMTPDDLKRAGLEVLGKKWG